MPVDVLTEIVIERSIREVAAFACDPEMRRSGYVNTKSIEWKTPPLVLEEGTPQSARTKPIALDSVGALCP